MLELSEEPLDARILMFLNQDPIGDGGQYDMAINILEVREARCVRHPPLRLMRIAPSRNMAASLRPSIPKASRRPHPLH
jgi:hypothetical protein